MGASQVATRTYYKRGSATSSTLYTTSSTSVTKQGTKCPYTLYYKSSSGAYLSMGESMYYAGSSATYYTRSKYADAGELYWDGGSETVTVITEEYEGSLYKAGTRTSVKQQGDLLETALYYQGPSYSGGLYHNFKLAELSTRDVTALTV